MCFSEVAHRCHCGLLLLVHAGSLAHASATHAREGEQRLRAAAAAAAAAFGKEEQVVGDACRHEISSVGRPFLCACCSIATDKDVWEAYDLDHEMRGWREGGR